MQRRRAPATALFFLLLCASCARTPHAPLAIRNCTLDARPVTKNFNFGSIHGRPGDARYTKRLPVMTLSATLSNVAQKAIVSARFTWTYRFNGATRRTLPAYYDTYWRIPPGHEVHVKWWMGIRHDLPPVATQAMDCKLWAVTFEDGTTWAGAPGQVAGGDADRHHGPL